MIGKFNLLLDRRQRRSMVILMAGMLFASLLEMLGIGTIPMFVALLADPDRVFQALPSGSVTSVIREADFRIVILGGAALLAAIFLAKNVFIAGLIFAESKLVRDITVATATRMFRAYLYNPYTFHLQRNPAKLARNVSNEVTQSVNLISSGMVVVREGLVLIVVLVLLLFLDPLTSLSTFVLLGSAATLFYMAVRHSLLRRGRLAQAHRGRQLQTINQGLGAIKDAKILGREHYLISLFSREVRGVQHNAFYQRVVSVLPRLFLEVLAVSAIVLVAVVFVLLGRTVESMLPVLALLAVGTVRLVPAFNSISSALTLIRFQRPALDLVCAELEAVEHEVAPGASNSAVVTTARFKFQNEISLHDLHYRYPGAAVEALRGVGLTIRAGETVGFIGASGAGKSTLIDLMLGLLTPTSGEIHVDGQKLEGEFLPSWQRQIGYIPQQIYLIDDSVRRNVAFGLPDDEIDETAVTRALSAAQLEAFVQSLPEGVDTRVGDRGIRLSGGQRQRIGIARALYHNPGVLLMDEATSALDQETEHEVVTAIGQLRSDHTIIVIAHRLTTVRGCDRLYLLDEGRVIDEGRPVELAGRHARLRAPLSAGDEQVGLV